MASYYDEKVDPVTADLVAPRGPSPEQKTQITALEALKHRLESRMSEIMRSGSSSDVRASEVSAASPPASGAPASTYPPESKRGASIILGPPRNIDTNSLAAAQALKKRYEEKVGAAVFPTDNSFNKVKSQYKASISPLRTKPNVPNQSKTYGKYEDLLDENLLGHLKEVEQYSGTPVGKGGYKGKGLFVPYPSLEDTSKTIGYGHKIKPGESFDIHSQDEIEALLREDTVAAIKSAARDVDNKYGEGTFDRLPKKSKQVLAEFKFNLGNRLMSKFPKFVDAVVKGDLDAARKESIRSFKDRRGHRRKLTRRNKLTIERFLTPDTGE